jgi:hypothetical protein
MEYFSANVVVKALLLAWSIVYLPYAMIVVWAGTGPNALAGPATMAENIFGGVWLLLSILQLSVAIALGRRYRPWLFWVAMFLVVLSVGSVIMGPILALLGVK